MNKLIFILCLFLLTTVKILGQAKPVEPPKNGDTIKCYVQIMVPASRTVGLSREIEDNTLFLNGGIFLYTKAYGIKDGGKYVKFLTPRHKELKEIWWPESGPVVMRKDW